ncbi:hypothetical protein ACE6H2_017874 [Prunus campanulata]
MGYETLLCGLLQWCLSQKSEENNANLCVAKYVINKYLWHKPKEKLKMRMISYFELGHHVLFEARPKGLSSSLKVLNKNLPCGAFWLDEDHDGMLNLIEINSKWLMTVDQLLADLLQFERNHCWLGS